MTDKAFRAKAWLNRNYNDHKQLEADRRMLEIMSNRLQSGVAKYETDGSNSRDPDKSRARHEDDLLEFSAQHNKVENEEKALVYEMQKTRNAIEQLDDHDLRAIATDRYINRLRWEDIAKLEHISIAQAYLLNKKMLEKMADIINI